MRRGAISPGDTVRIREWKDMAGEYGYADFSKNIIRCPGLIFVSGMKVDCGREITVKDVERLAEYDQLELEYASGRGIIGTISNYMVEPIAVSVTPAGDDIMSLLFGNEEDV